MAKCWKCGTSFREPYGEEGEHGCPNPACHNHYDSYEDEDEEDEYESCD